MDTNRLKKFAIEARNILKAGIAAKLTSLGFDSKGGEFTPATLAGRYALERTDSLRRILSPMDAAL